MLKGLYQITIDQVGGSIIPNGVIIFSEKGIHFVGEEGAAIPFPHSEIKWIDGKNGVLTPGLIDVHTHLGIHQTGIGWEGHDFNETSEPITPHLRAIDGIYSFDQGYWDAVKAGVTTVQVLPGSANVVGGLTAVIKVKPDRTVEEQLIQFPAGLKIALGENPKKVHGQKGRSGVTRMGIAGMLREAFYHALERANKNKLDLRTESFLLALNRDIPVRAHAHRADDILTALRIAKEFQLDLTLEHVTDGIRVAKEIKQSGYRVVIGPTLSAKSKVELALKTWDIYRVFEEMDIPFSITTDHPVIPIDQLLTTARLAIANGLSPERALQAVTIDAAKHLHLEKRIGSLEVGKDADFVLWSSHPLHDFHAHVRQTWVDGECIWSGAKENED